MISVSFFMFLLWIIEENAPGVGFLFVFIGPGGGGGFELFLPEGGNSPIKKLPREMVRLGIDTEGLLLVNPVA